MLERQIEEASLNAWPALQHVLFDGWIVRFSEGYTKRANSVNALFASSMDVGEKIVTCETLYAEKRLPAVFRITPFVSPPELDRVLADRGYERVSPTLVLHLDLAAWEPAEALPGQLREEPLDAWLPLFCQLKSTPLAQHQTHREILQAIPSQRLPAALIVDGQAIACAVGVLERGFFGLFDVVTDPQYRRRGYGTSLIAQMLAWAKAHAKAYAYIQVEAENGPARALYGKLGFTEIYQYWYRVGG